MTSPPSESSSAIWPSPIGPRWQSIFCSPTVRNSARWNLPGTTGWCTCAISLQLRHQYQCLSLAPCGRLPVGHVCRMEQPPFFHIAMEDRIWHSRLPDLYLHSFSPAAFGAGSAGSAAHLLRRLLHCLPCAGKEKAGRSGTPITTLTPCFDMYPVFWTLSFELNN